MNGSVTDIRVTPNPQILTLRKKKYKTQKERLPKPTDYLLKLEIGGKVSSMYHELTRFPFLPMEKIEAQDMKKIQLQTVIVNYNCQRYIAFIKQLYLPGNILSIHPIIYCQ